MLTKIATDRFLSENGGLDFHAVKFRPGSSFTSPFGLDDTFGKLRIHNAIDRGSSHPEIYNPFTATRAEFIKGYPSFGTMLIIHTVYGFQVRIAHIENLSRDMELAAVMKDRIPRGLYIGKAGAAGESAGIHTHTEIVSEDSGCQVLDEVINRKYGPFAITEPFSDQHIADYCAERKLPGDPAKAYKDECDRRGVLFLNKYVCDRMDYHTGQPRRFYSSRALFGM